MYRVTGKTQNTAYFFIGGEHDTADRSLAEEEEEEVSVLVGYSGSS
jgi:hypothetical protein